ncbi:nuclear transport factor 2 family protein [Pseudovibrio sp. WM33]|uniref:nuclear transport factor 2 family protein n=1 Tax=Pseudovibrio sp. WM33 TaxID=1735585 RepID=UPI0007B28E7B|nr:nuclear transport factor 2 family protein [Pseudovibrio sp. WM33]KZL22197.1 hypothetical protein PsWM33_04131 [Pseudovibrio sp. WM33]
MFYLQGVTKFIASYVFMLVVIFTFNLMVIQFVDETLSFWKSAWSMGMVAGFLLGFKINEDLNAKPNVRLLMQLGVLCFVGLSTLQGFVSYLGSSNLLEMQAAKNLRVDFDANWVIPQFGLILLGLWLGVWFNEKFGADRLLSLSSCEALLLPFENQLLDPTVRGSRKQLELLLHADFIEIGASGRMYDRAQVLAELPSEATDYPVRTIENFRLRKLSENLVQVFYSIVENETQRTSIWKLEGEQWSMIYHQGTRRAS